MKTTLRLSIMFVLVVVQALVPVSAGARAEAHAAPSMPPALYSAFLDASAKGAPAFHGNGSGYSLEAGGLHADFNSAGLFVSKQNGAAWTWNLQLDGFGRQGQTASLSAPKVSQAAGGLELGYQALSEWYRTTGIGLEQGFTIQQKPAGSGEVVLQMQLDTSLSGSVSVDHRSISFNGGKGQVLHYSNLRALDARDRELNARLVYQTGQIAIQIDDQGAAYPLTVDPLIYIEDELFALDGAANDWFGYSVAISGDYALVGVPHAQVGSNPNQGAAYIFLRQGITWIQQAELSASDGVAYGPFGTTVALSGNTALVGEPDYEDNLGRVLVFVKPASGWATRTETAILTASDAASGDVFGQSVAISGDSAVIGAPDHKVGSNVNQGEAYLFVKPVSGWISTTQTATLTALDGLSGDIFGQSVAISGDSVVIGAGNHNSAEGEAYVFVKPDDGWGGAQYETASLTPSDGGGSFGQSVAISGDTAVIGAGGHNSNQGEAYVFVKPGSGWASGTENAILTASDGLSGDSFGQSVAISGDSAVIGAPSHNSYQGEAYVFVKPASGWATGTETTRLTASDGAANDYFGHSVATSGDTAFIGAMGNENVAGAAYVYYPVRSEDLSVNAVSSTTSPLIGQTVTFTVSVTNLGPDPSPAVMLSAPLPAGFSLVKSASRRGSYDPVTAFWNVSSLGGYVTATLQLQATVTPVAFGTSLVFSAALLGWDPNPTNNVSTVVMNPVPYLDIRPSSLDFGQQMIGASGLGKVFTVTNQTLIGITFGASDLPSGFIVSGNTCVGVLAGLATCNITVNFKPSWLRAYSGNVRISTATPIHFWAIMPVSGTGISPLNLSPSSLDFGQQAIVASGPGHVFTVTNQTLGHITFGSLTVPAGFILSGDTCSLATVAGSDTCSFTVQFKPTKLSAYSGNVNIPTTDPIHFSVNMPVSGMGISPLNLSPSSIDFGDVYDKCSTSNSSTIKCPKKTVIVTNLSTASVILGSLVIPKGFILVPHSDICSGKTLKASAICTFILQFTPGSALAYSGDVSIPFTIAGLHLTVNLPVIGNGLPLTPVSMRLIQVP